MRDPSRRSSHPTVALLLLLTVVTALTVAPSGCTRQGQGPVYGDTVEDDETQVPDWARGSDADTGSAGGLDATPRGSEPDAGSAPADAPPSDDAHTAEVDAGPPPPPVAAPELRVGTWNLHNFSKYGDDDWRLDAIIAEVQELDVDLLGLQELKVIEGSEGDGPQAFDFLVEAVPDMEGVHNPWNPNDTAVGLMYRPETTEILAQQPLFQGDWYPFPRPPLDVSLRVTKGDRTATFDIIVLHLKAFADGYERRKEACEKLHAWLQQKPDGSRQYLIVGDLNDSPYSDPAINAFDGTFLELDHYDFVTAALPPQTVTSLGWYHDVDGQKIDGQFFDHVILTDEMCAWFETATPGVHGVPASEHETYEEELSDHFPVVVTLTPAPD